MKSFNNIKRAKGIGKVLLSFSVLYIFPLLISCEDWFDVTPKSQVKEEALFSSESGFQDALFGVYSLMGTTDIYGGNSTMGLMDILAQNYSELNSINNMVHALSYDYDDSTVKGCIDSQWQGYYQAIANCNYLLKNIESNGKKISEPIRKLVEGEAYAIRAYLLFDALRGYAPSYTVGKDMRGIPYVDHVTNAPVRPLTVAETIERLISDLQYARELVKEIDPIGPAFDVYTEEPSYSVSDYSRDGGFWLYRSSRMNYWAMTALLARISLYKGDKSHALEYANEVIQSNRFRFATNNIIDAAANSYPSLKLMECVAHNEYIFGIYVYGLKEKCSDNYFMDYSVQATISQIRKNAVFTPQGIDFDIRAKRFFALSSSSSREYSAKYMTGTQIPLLKIGEMYLIAAEASGDIKYLKELRRQRGYSSDEDTSNFEQLLTGEYQREFIAEGQLFYYYKRLNFNEIPFSGIAATDKIYVLPLSDDEIEFGNY